MPPQHRSRVYVGVNGSLASLRALRQAVTEARHRRAELHVVYVRKPIPSRSWQTGVAGSAATAPPRELQPEFLEAQAENVIRESVQQGLGGVPGDLVVRHRVMVGKPANELARLGWWDDDVLVVGSGRRRWRRWLRRSVGAYCVRRAQCPVLVVPLDHFASSVVGRRGWHRSPLRRDPWKQFDEATSRDPQPIR